MNKKRFANFSGKCTCRDCFTLNTRGPQQYLGKLWSLNNNPTPNVPKNIFPTALLHQKPDLIKGSMDPCFHVVYDKF